MRLFGLTITREKHVPASSLGYRGGWWPLVSEPFTGAWQRNQELKIDIAASHNVVYACITLIAADIAKLRLKLVQQDSHGIWTETENPAHSPVLRKPNRYQTRIDFFQSWLVSKLAHGNTYVLKERDNRNVVIRLYVLDPTRVKPLVTPDGDVYYELSQDNLSRLSSDGVVVPASEIIHDKMTALFHPLCGVSPLYAGNLATAQALKIHNHAVKFFENGANPGGILTAPAAISPETAERIREHWQQNFSGNNVGRVAVLGDGLSYQPMFVNAVDSQLIEQLKLTGEMICTAFHVPPYMVGVGPMPTYDNIEALNQQYYGQCLQIHIESIEALLDEGLGLQRPLGTEFDIEGGLLRMDTKSRTEAATAAIKGGLSPNEVRMRFFDMGPVDGGQLPFLQEQNWPISLLASRAIPEREPTAPDEPPAPSPEDEAEAEQVRGMIRRAELAAALGMKAVPQSLH